MKKAGCSLFLLTFLITAYSQSAGSLQGTLTDTAAKQPIADATITLFHVLDSTLAAFSRSHPDGHFQINHLEPGNYRLLITHVGYHAVSKNFTITQNNPLINMGDIVLTNTSVVLNAVTVTQEVAPVTIKKDTIEYNAGSFNTKPNAVVEDLLKKLPGVQVDKNGTIKANGEEVKKILVDGKEFFGRDPKIASKNLPADAIDKVQVFDKKSEQSQFTGFDDGNSEKTINLTIKPDKKNGIFGKAMAGLGDQGRYEEKLNFNQFSGNKQLSILGMANNTNKQGFTFQDVLNFSGGLNANGGRGGDIFNSGIPVEGLSSGNPGITTLLAAGLNFNNSWHKRTDLNGSYFYNNTEDRIEQKSTSQYILPDSSFTQSQYGLTNRQNINHRLNAILDHQFDSANSIRLGSIFVQQNSHADVFNNYESNSNSGQLLNKGQSENFSSLAGFDWNNNLLYRHRFKKKGRTVSANIVFDWNNSSGDGKLYSVNQFYQPGNPYPGDTINQVNNKNNSTRNISSTLSYTEPLSKKSLLEFSYYYSDQHFFAAKNTFDADGSGKFNIPNPTLTDAFTNDFNTHRETIGFRNQQKKYNLSIGLGLEESATNNKFSYLYGDSSLQQHNFSLLPNASFQYNFNKYSNLRGMYYTFTQQPSTQQLQPVPDNSDPLNIIAGNPELKQEYFHQVRLNYISFDPFRRTSFFAMINYAGVHNKIVNDDSLSDAGVRISWPVNTNGLFNINSMLSWSFPFRKIKSTVNLNSNIGFNSNASYVNGIINSSKNWNLAQSADITYQHGERYDLTLGFKVNYNSSRYSLSNEQNQDYWKQNYSLDYNWYLPKGFSIATDINYEIQSGLSTGYNYSPLIWNAGLAKQLFANKKGEIRVQVFDLLNQNVSTSRNTSQNYIQDISYTVLGRYWLLSFTYNIRRFAGKSISGNDGKKDAKLIVN